MSIFSTNLAKNNWASKYQYKDETPLETFERVAEELAEVEREYGAGDGEVEDYKHDFLTTLVNFEKTDLEKEDVNNDEDFYIDNRKGKFDVYKPVGLKCTPGGRITANIGTDYEETTLLNCFIASPIRNAALEYIEETEYDVEDFVIEGDKDTPDDLVNIFGTLLENGMTLKSEGGWGLNLGHIRPKGSFIEGTGTRHPGVVAYMELFNRVSSVIVRGCEDGYEDNIENHVEGDPFQVDKPEKAQSRKGAMLAALPVWHPDIEEYCRVKKESNKLEKFNISVLIDDQFIEAVKNDEMYELHFEGKVYKKVRAKELYDLIVESTYECNDPGLLLYDNMNRCNPTLYLGPDDATNPCGEVPGSSFTDKGYKEYAKDYLKPYLNDDDHNIGRSTVCLLGSINLTQYVTEDRKFDWKQYGEDVKTFTRMLDNVNDIGNVPLEMYNNALKKIRQFGMGINGLGSALLMMGIEYGSDECLEFVEKVCYRKEQSTLETSAQLAKEKEPAPLYSDEWLETPYAKNESGNVHPYVRKKISENGLRNLKTTTNPPLGSSSIICDNVSNGIEPLFSTGYKRNVIVDEWPEGLNKDNVKEKFEKEQQGKTTVWKGEYNGQEYIYEPSNRGLCYKEEVVDYGYDWLRKNYPDEVDADYVVTANELDVSTHIDVQAKVQDNVNQSVSKTINVPNDYPYEDFKDLYLEAHEKGLVGLTTYRAGTASAVLESNDKDNGESSDKTLPEMLESQGYIKSDYQLNKQGVIVRGIDLPNKFINGPTEIFNGDGNKYYAHFSYLPEDKSKQNEIAFFVLTNDLEDKEWVSINRAVKALEYLMINKGVDQDLVTRQTEKIKNDEHPVRLSKMISFALRHNISKPEIVEAISDIEGDYVASTLSKVRKFLRSKIEDGTEASIQLCDRDVECDVIYESGCTKCKQCGYAGCD